MDGIVTAVASQNGLNLRAPGEKFLLLGFLSLAIPTLIRLGQISWAIETGAHGPIVLATGIWLIWKESDVFRSGKKQPLFPAFFVLLPALAIYGVGRITSVIMLETIGLYIVALSLVYLRFGLNVFKVLWFPFVYMLFLITPPENWVFVATRPLKMGITDLAVAILSSCGMSVGNSGSVIQVDGYQVMVASACSGLNSLIGISALSLFYVYLKRGSNPLYAFSLSVLLLPIALLTNLIRVVLLILATAYFGPSSVEGVAHDLAAVGTFALALLLLFVIDEAIFPIFNHFKLVNR